MRFFRVRVRSCVVLRAWSNLPSTHRLDSVETALPSLRDSPVFPHFSPRLAPPSTPLRATSGLQYFACFETGKRFPLSAAPCVETKRRTTQVKPAPSPN